jgi:hypothetical protein
MVARLGESVWRELDPREVWERASPVADDQWKLQQIVFRIHERNSPWYKIEYAILDTQQNRRSLGRADWADWDRNGDLLVAKDGQIFRLPRHRLSAENPLAEARQLVDLRGEVFYGLAAPEEAKDWFAEFVRAERPAGHD